MLLAIFNRLKTLMVNKSTDQNKKYGLCRSNYLKQTNKYLRYLQNQRETIKKTLQIIHKKYKPMKKNIKKNQGFK